MANQSDDLFDIDFNKLSIIQQQGYNFFYMPEHPLSVYNGMVALHRHIISVHLRRWIRGDEAVVFLNDNRSDIRLENLKLIPRNKIMEEKGLNKRLTVERICPVCNQSFTTVPSRIKRRQNNYCSQECSRIARVKVEIDPEELAELVWEMPTVQVANLFGISDKAIEKKCKKYGIAKPPRGYWAKLAAGQIDPLLKDELHGKTNPFQKG